MNRLPEMAMAEVTRITAEGRKLNYALKVIQQPERARACGSGAKCEHNASYQTLPRLLADFQ